MFQPCRVLDLADATVLVFADAKAAWKPAAALIAKTIRSSIMARKKAVLGLATGATPIPVYAELVALKRQGELSFRDVTTYNLDEYYPICPSNPNSYHTYMHEHLFRHVDLAPNRAHVLDGTVPEEFAHAHAAEFDRWIEADGGLDLQLLGIGRNGHIGFNEPTGLTVEQALTLPTRIVDLHPVTIADAVKEFGVESKVIRRALTLGISTILASRSVLILAFGSAKAEAVQRALLGPMMPGCPASLLQSIPGKVTWMIDEAAAECLA